MTAAGEARRGHLTLAAYDYVKDQILDGRSKPGSRLSVNDIMAAIGASRQPVMTALRRLAAEGFVEITPQSGCRVHEPDRHAMASFFRAFAAVEGVAAEIAAEQPPPVAVTILEQINATMQELGERTGMSQAARGEAYRRLNQDFHRAIHTLSRSNAVSSLSESLWDKADFYIANTPVLGGSRFSARIATSYREHEAIIDAIREGRPGDARRLMEAHIRAFSHDGLA